MNDKIEEYLASNRDTHLSQLKDFLAIPSISTQTEHKGDMEKAAEWTAESLRQLGMDNVKVYETKGHPVVYGEWLKAEGKPTALIYGHYDVQPVDPVELWNSPPFSAEIRDEKLYARGASDDKGQTFMHFKALEAFLETTGTLPLNFKFCIEGEEEMGSPNLPAFAEEHKDLLAADLIVVSDTGMIEKGKPAITYGLRGLCGLQIDLKGPSGDVHSGLYGGVIQNPIHALVKIVDSFHSEDGHILVDGFYDDVLTVTEQEKEEFASLQFNEEEVKKELGVNELYGEEGYSYLERTWTRPTLEVNGIYGGYQGGGLKTVLPSEAHAKISCRLVPNQDPDKIVEQLKQHITKHLPAGVEVEMSRFDQGHPYLTPIDHPYVQAAGEAYEKVYDVKTSYIRSGGSIPIIATFKQLFNLPIVLMGFGLPNENFHAPNEHFHLENFDKGMRVLCHYWEDIAKMEL
ncbi:dipeptidase [Fictibacillus sp. KU28468]|uniref:dipeptidase n=1 Tax=Fictibacillus sp. KU28468 TaxID=2991053 RepID=UPI00223CEE20|nr:dipeptidase [Fictibacillus sp. KU28468]UZJ79531.1 dipeptidase [Fictibacillus sp. KU28468]